MSGDVHALVLTLSDEELDEKRRAWLNPPDLVDIVPEVVPTAAPGEAPVKYPDRILPKNADAALRLKERTLTKLYNERPQWLASLHDELDRAVAACGWPGTSPSTTPWRGCWRSTTSAPRRDADRHPRLNPRVLAHS